MTFPNDRTFTHLQTDAEQRRLLRGGRGFLMFCRTVLFGFLIIGIVGFILACWNAFRDSRNTDAVPLWPIVFVILWILIVLSLMRLVSTQLAGIKREQEAEQSLGGASETRTGDGTASGGPQG